MAFQPKGREGTLVFFCAITPLGWFTRAFAYYLGECLFTDRRTFEQTGPRTNAVYAARECMHTFGYNTERHTYSYGYTIHCEPATWVTPKIRECTADWLAPQKLPWQGLERDISNFFASQFKGFQKIMLSNSVKILSTHGLSTIT